MNFPIKENLRIEAPTSEAFAHIVSFFKIRLKNYWSVYKENSTVYPFYREGSFGNKQLPLPDSNYTHLTYPEFLNMIDNKKIIGYRAPMDLFTSTPNPIKKGDLLVPYTINTTAKASGQYVKKDYNPNGYATLPREIVETWEPVYAPEFKTGDYVYITKAENGATAANGKFGTITDEPSDNGKLSGTPGIRVNIRGEVWNIGENPDIRLATAEEIDAPKIGDYLYIIKEACIVRNCSVGYVGKISEIKEGQSSDYTQIYYFEDGAVCSNRKGCTRKASEEEIKEAEFPIIGDYRAKLQDNKIKFGCVHLTKEDLKSYEYLINSEARAKITVKGVEITPEFIIRLLKHFK